MFVDSNSIKHASNESFLEKNSADNYFQVQLSLLVQEVAVNSSGDFFQSGIHAKRGDV